MHYRSLQQLFRWLVEDGEITDSPMARTRPPQVPEQPVDVFTDDELRRLLAACRGSTFENRRDSALLRMLIDTGMRAAELCGLAVDDLDDLDDEQGVTHVMGKGRRGRAVPYGPKTADALRRYRRARAAHPQAALPELWIGKKGPLTDSGLRQVLECRAADAGVENVHPHRFRHGAAAAARAGRLRPRTGGPRPGCRSSALRPRRGARHRPAARRGAGTIRGADMTEPTTDVTTEPTNVPGDVQETAQEPASEVPEPEVQDGQDPAAATRKEAAAYRRRLRDTEGERDRLAERDTGDQRREVEALAELGRGHDRMLSGADLWTAGVQITDLLDEDGAVDAGKGAGRGGGRPDRAPALAQEPVRR